MDEDILWSKGLTPRFRIRPTVLCLGLHYLGIAGLLERVFALSSFSIVGKG
ncbi:MAG: hypothetical protein WBD28_10065 [Candidatus Zixiibacteriota bacterium]